MAHLSAQSAIGAPHATSEVATTPFPVQLGTRMRDSAGNEYIYCDFTGTVYSGVPVLISSGFTAEKIGITGRGPVGVACCAATSDNAGWVQIYGRAYVQVLAYEAGVSPSESFPTTLSTSVQCKFTLPTTATSTGAEGVNWTTASPCTLVGYIIQGMTVASDVSMVNAQTVPALKGTSSTSPSNVSAETSHTGADIAVFLNYPQVSYINYGA